jgi:hypothetical protein
MTEDYQKQADAAEREVAEMEERSERVGEQIEETRKDWEAKVEDPAVPGAAGDPDRAEEGGQHPETAYPGKGPEDEVSDPDPTDNDRGVDDTPDGESGDVRDRGAGDELPPPDPTETD